ncbi:MAG: hypothetical protein AAB453_01165 [Patescibacteria group bacterium]
MKKKWTRQKKLKLVVVAVVVIGLGYWAKVDYNRALTNAFAASAASGGF